jgi:hypothetical protein
MTKKFRTRQAVPADEMLAFVRPRQVHRPIALVAGRSGSILVRMETDIFFWRLLKQIPQTLFELLDLPPQRARRYRFEAVEVKKSFCISKFANAELRDRMIGAARKESLQMASVGA